MNLFVFVAILAAVGVNVAFSRRLSKVGGDMCLSGDGSNYRGTVHKSSSGRFCRYWDKVKPQWGDANGLGSHNYCRNPNRDGMPWCFVRKARRIVREFCDIPKCPTQASVDTEQTCGEISERRMHKIVGGSVTPIESQPWVAAIFDKRDGFLCGGTLISPCWVLTAAHCFSEGGSTKFYTVHLGKRALNETDGSSEQRFTVEKLIKHEEYDDISFNNDIALIKLKSKTGGCAVKSPSARIACLPPLNTKLPPGFTCSIAGFGKESSGAFQYSQYLKQAEVKLMSNAECSQDLLYGNRITDNMFCAASPDWSIDACKGDSGGPLLCRVSDRMFLFGVVSWGEGCAQKNKPGVYTEVTQYNKWITEKTGIYQYTNGLMYPQK